MTTNEKYDKLVSIIQDLENAAVAFSGGVDSSFLAMIVFKVLSEKSVAITIVSPMMPKTEINDSKEIAASIGIKHILLEDNVIDEIVAKNPVDRCYHCKKIEFSNIIKKAETLRFTNVLDGSNVDDSSDYRPGSNAAKELNVLSPLKEAGLCKQDIRDLSKSFGLRTWDKPSYACLASRIPYGEIINGEKLARIENSEDYLRSLGFKQFRVRCHQNIARIELSPEEREKLFNTSIMDSVSKKIKSFGFTYVCMELEGYKTGNMNSFLSKSDL